MLEPISHLIPILFIIAMLLIFPSVSKQRGIMIVVLAGFLFLPEINGIDRSNLDNSKVIKLGPIVFGKYASINMALLLIMLIYDSNLLFSSKPGIFDLPVITLSFCPLISALTNDPPPDGSLPIRDGLAQMYTMVISFLPTYMAGRIYFTKPQHFRELCLSLIVGGIAYLPFCLWELRMSPQLHNNFFGFAQHSFGQTIRFDGYRPMVFTPHGLVLALFIMQATLITFWLNMTWKNDKSKKRLRLFLWLLLPVMVLLKSTGALALFFVGFSILYFSKTTLSKMAMVCLIFTPILYVTVRTPQIWTGEDLVKLTEQWIGADRAESLEFRLKNENMLLERALEKPVFGWGGWGRNRVISERGDKDLSVTDGLWIIYLGCYGFTGLICTGLFMLLPTMRFAYLFPVRRWTENILAPVTVLNVVLVLWAIDCLMNGFAMPYQYLIAGALLSVTKKEFQPAVVIPGQIKTSTGNTIPVLRQTPAIETV